MHASQLWRLVLVRATANLWKAAECLAAAGLFSMSMSLVGAPAVESDEFLCEVCGLWFPCKRSVAQHRIKAHQCNVATRRLRSLFVGSSCQFCGSEFHSRMRLLKHLRTGRSSCVAAASSFEGAPVCAEAAVAADEIDRLFRAAQRLGGRSDVAGPWAILGDSAA